MKTTTKLFLAYMEHKARRDGPAHTFEEYVTLRPDLASLILVHLVADEAGIPRIPLRTRRGRGKAAHALP